MARFGFAAFAVLLMLFAGCHEARDVNGAEPPGAMSYAGYDASGRLVVTGWIQLDVALFYARPGSSVSGTWNLHAFADPVLIGPQSGSGVLVGRLVEGGVAVDLFPPQSPSNLELVGTLNGLGTASMRFEGTWRWNTFTGPGAAGRFVATQAPLD